MATTAPSFPRKRESHFFLSEKGDEIPAFAGMTDKEQGFTLIELLVALGIFAMIAVAGGYLLGFSVRAQGDTGRALDRIASVRRASVLLTADMAQIVPRTSRDERGDRRPALVGAPDAIGFVRAGWTNDSEAPRPDLQKVGYRLADGALERTSWPMVDGVSPDRAVHSPLVRGVRKALWRYRREGQWVGQWEPRFASDLPDAVELVMTIDGVGEVRQLMLVGSRR